MKYFLLDTNITAGYYLPLSLENKKAKKYIEEILNYLRLNPNDYFSYIPNFCIAEVFNVFYKYAYGKKWNKEVKKNGYITKSILSKLIKSFERDVHNGSFFYHYELSRYHILSINLVSSVDNYYLIRKKKNVTPCSTFDKLIITMGIELSFIHGPENVCILTADNRLADLLKVCKKEYSETMIKKLNLDFAGNFTGKKFSKDIFPHCLNLNKVTTKELVDIFGNWPLNIKKPPSLNKYFRYVK